MTINLNKDGIGKIKLDKRDPNQVLTATLEWQRRSGFRRFLPSNLELVAQRIPTQGSSRDDIYWKKLGDDTAEPYILHHGDSKKPGTEKITIHNLAAHKYVGLFVYSQFWNLSGSLFSYGAKVTVTDGNGQTVTAPLYNDKESYWASFAVIDFTQPGGVQIRHHERYSDVGKENWPELHTNGRITMSTGRVEIKMPWS